MWNYSSLVEKNGFLICAPKFVNLARSKQIYIIKLFVTCFVVNFLSIICLASLIHLHITHTNCRNEQIGTSMNCHYNLKKSLSTTNCHVGYWWVDTTMNKHRWFWISTFIQSIQNVYVTINKCNSLSVTSITVAGLDLQ